jgi:pyruvate,water dikinase
MTPLGQDAARGIFAGAAGLFGYEQTWQTQQALYSAAERLYIDFTGLIRHRLWRRLLRAALDLIEPGASQAMASLWDDPRLVANQGFDLQLARRLTPVLLPILANFGRTLLRPDSQRARFKGEIETLIGRFEARLATATTLTAQLSLMEEVLATTLRYLLPRFVPRFGPGMAGLNLLNHLASELPDSETHPGLVTTRGLPHNVTTEMDLALWAAAQQIRSDPAALAHMQQGQPQALADEYRAARLPERAQAALAGFLQRYGVRGPGEIDLGRPRWREDPTPVLQVLQSYLQIEDPERAPDLAFARGARAAEAAIEELAAAVRGTRGGWLKARLVHWAARRLRSLAGLRETPKFAAVRLMGLVRAGLLDSGRDLVAEGLLDEPQDLFFLHLDELQDLAEVEGATRASDRQKWQTLVQQRREVYRREAGRQQVPRLLLSDGQAFYEGVRTPPEEAAGVLHGSPVSPGMVEGPVHVVHDPRGVQLAPGEILVCPGTDPAWTPLFLVAGGLVMEVGGLMTHGSVVAREYGIPAVVGVSRATTRLQAGQQVRVDGTKGSVTLL